MLKTTKGFDFIIIGAGIVGLSVAYNLIQKKLNCKIALLDKEEELGKHASGRNSGVLHSGIFYKEESLKAKVCFKGSQKMKEFALEHDIPIFTGGKVIVPTEETQYSTLNQLLINAKNNGIKAHLIDAQQLQELEPSAYLAEKAIYCPDTAVIDNKLVLKKLKALLEKNGVEFIFNCQVTNVDSEKQQLMTNQGLFKYNYYFNCAGAYADQIAKYEGLAKQYTLLPFKGIYYKLEQKSADRIKSNIYPVPNILTPFLGVHFTRSISGEVYVGPTAIPVFGRENYYRFKGINFSETSELCVQLMKLFISNENNFRYVARSELQKYSKKIFFWGAKKLVPSLKIQELLPCSKVGIRPQLINKKTAALEMDYIFEQTPNSIHVLNAISPAFTSSFAFADMILEKSKGDFLK